MVSQLICQSTFDNYRLKGNSVNFTNLSLFAGLGEYFMMWGRGERPKLNKEEDYGIKKLMTSVAMLDLL